MPIKYSFATLLAIMIFYISGCASATMVATSDDLGGEGGRWGIVKYLNGGADFVINSRRDDARSQMTEYCFPEGYKVLNAAEDSQYGGSVPLYGVSVATSYNYVKIRFECIHEIPHEKREEK